MVLLADCIRRQSRLRDAHGDKFAGSVWETVPGLSLPTGDLDAASHNLTVEPNDDVCTTLYVSPGLLQHARLQSASRLIARYGGLQCLVQLCSTPIEPLLACPAKA